MATASHPPPPLRMLRHSSTHYGALLSLGKIHRANKGTPSWSSHVSLFIQFATPSPVHSHHAHQYHDKDKETVPFHWNEYPLPPPPINSLSHPFVRTKPPSNIKKNPEEFLRNIPVVSLQIPLLLLNDVCGVSLSSSCCRIRSLQKPPTQFPPVPPLRKLH